MPGAPTALSSRPATTGHLPAAAGAVAGQLTLAAGSFVLQLLAARTLGASGLGLFALLVGSIIIATALTSGLIGDSLTVLDRHDPAIRSALAWLAAAVIAVAVGAALAGGSVAGLASSTTLLFGAATGAFMTADLMRRTLMACQRFWRLVLVDGTALAASLLLLAWLARGGLGIGAFLSALCLGQVIACVVAWASLPPLDRVLPARSWGDPRAVIGFGCWRAAQQFVRPTALNLMRWLVLGVAGQAAVGELEGARIFVAPAMLLVQGIGAYLFSSYAHAREQPLALLLRRADRGAAVLLAGSLGLAVAATLAVPVFGDLMTGGDYDLAVAAVLGWGVYAASCALVLPYGSLAAVRGHQAKVLGLRVVDSLAGLGAVAAALWWLGMPTSAAPWLLSVGSVAAGALIRQRLLAPGAATS